MLRGDTEVPSQYSVASKVGHIGYYLASGKVKIDWDHYLYGSPPKYATGYNRKRMSYSTPRSVTSRPRYAPSQKSYVRGRTTISGKDNEIRRVKKPCIRKNYALGPTAQLYDLIAPTVTVSNKFFHPRSMATDGLIDAPRDLVVMTSSGPQPQYLYPTTTYPAPVAQSNALRTTNPKDLSGIQPFERVESKVMVSPDSLEEDATSTKLFRWDQTRQTPGTYKTIDDDAGFTIIQFPILTTSEAHNYVLKARDVAPTVPTLDQQNTGSDLLQYFDYQGGSNNNVAFNPSVSNTGGSYTSTDPTLMTNKVTDINAYGALEEFKMSFSFQNQNEVSMIFELMQVCPREGLIADIWGDFKLEIAALQSNAMPAKGDPNPLNVLTSDWKKHRETMNARMASFDQAQRFPKLDIKLNDENHDINHRYRFEDAKLGSWAKQFNKTYKIQNQKSYVIKPGGRIDYDVVIPGFGYRFNKYCQLLKKEGTDDEIAFKEIYSTFTRFLIVKFKSALVNKDISNAVDQSFGHVRLGKSVRAKIKLAVNAKKFFRSRMLPSYHKKHHVLTGGHNDIDWIGSMQNVENKMDVVDVFNTATINTEEQARQRFGQARLPFSPEARRLEEDDDDHHSEHEHNSDPGTTPDIP